MIRLEKTANRWTITLDRADKANALTRDMLARLDEIFLEAAGAEELRTVVITGAGDKVFCAGADLAEARQDPLFTTDPIWERVSSRLAGLPCLTICALNGTLAGGGFGLALACDLRIAVEGAGFFYPVLKNGFLPQPSDVRRMKRLIGPARTGMILLAAQRITSAQALAWGLIDAVENAGRMRETISNLAEAGEENARGLIAIKALIRQDGLSPEINRAAIDAVYNNDPAALERLRKEISVTA
ncbi:MAG: enoyl-CoA hydratase/isomerase family protein [Paracoccaceae bacterium]|nr:enoyl-CoA hydratase/isomerase family protein [Paracoccaceae bacterium]